LAGNDVDVNNPADLLDEPTRGENSNHILTGSGTDETGVLEGFIITSGNDNRYEQSPHYPFDWQAAGHGGGIYNDSVSIGIDIYSAWALVLVCAHVHNTVYDAGIAVQVSCNRNDSIITHVYTRRAGQKMIVAVNPDTVYVPVTPLNKTGVGVDITFAPDQCTTWAYINVLFATLDITIRNCNYRGVRAVPNFHYCNLRPFWCLVSPNDAVD
ncbi:unnamed protein product, partial [marine sediment metagenome]